MKVIKEKLLVEASNDVEKEFDKIMSSGDESYPYRMLSRLQSDFKYLLGASLEANGGSVTKGAVNQLWFKDISKQAELMRKLYNGLKEKPDWISIEDIDRYEKEALSKSDRNLTEAPADGAVPFKLPKSAMFDPDRLDLRGWGAQAKADADAKAAEEARAKAFAENKAKYADLIARAQAAGSSEDKLTVLFDELVPSSGNADTVAGELVRATMRLLYRDYNDGDVFYEGYGIETCGSSVAYLIYVIEYLYDTFEGIALRQLTDDAYTKGLTNVTDKVLDYIFTNDSVWQPNEDDSRSRELDKVYAEDYQSEWEPEYDYDFMIPPSVQAHIDAGNIITDEFIDRVRESLDGNGSIRYDRVEEGWSNYINITGLNRESYDEIEDWGLFEDSAWSDYIDELNDEYGDPEDEDEDEDDFDEAFQLRESSNLYNVGDKVKYNGKVTTVVGVENDPQYGVDYLIVNPDYDGTDSRYENIWVADKVDPV